MSSSFDPTPTAATDDPRRTIRHRPREEGRDVPNSSPSSSPSNSYDPLDPNLVGLSPQYWTYTPLSIGDVLSLRLIRGMDCYVTVAPEVPDDADGNRNTTDTRNSSSLKRGHALPLSRCELYGIITYLRTKSSSSGGGDALEMILDDGTGSIDCILWNDSLPVRYHLPSLAAGEGRGDRRHEHHVRKRRRGAAAAGRGWNVGDFVRMYGRIRCVSVLPETEKDVPRGRGRTDAVWDGGRSCVREVHVHGMERLDDGCGGGDAYVKETLHWLKCLQFAKRVNGTDERRMSEDGFSVVESTLFEDEDKDEDDEDIEEEEERGYRNQKRFHRVPVLNGADMFKFLSPSIDTTSVTTVGAGASSSHSSLLVDNLHRAHDEKKNGDHPNEMTTTTTATTTTAKNSTPHPSYASDMKYQNYFGRHCTCTHAYKEQLLYCHCLATSEPSDPFLRFRDEVLKKLLELEQVVIAEEEDDDNDEGGMRMQHELGKPASLDRNNDMDEKMVHGGCKDNDMVPNTQCFLEKDEAIDGNTIENDNELPKDENESERHSFSCLQFSYQTIAQDEKLLSVARQVVSPKMSSSSSVSTTNANIRKLFVNTFHCLRKDGILYLLDVDADIYLFLSKDRVLLPCVRKLVRDEDAFHMMRSMGRCGGPPAVPPLLPPFLDLSFSKERILRKIVSGER